MHAHIRGRSAACILDKGGALGRIKNPSARFSGNHAVVNVEALEAETLQREETAPSEVCTSCRVPFVYLDRREG
jgi:hypothetical protein